MGINSLASLNPKDTSYQEYMGYNNTVSAYITKRVF